MVKAHVCSAGADHIPGCTSSLLELSSSWMSGLGAAPPAHHQLETEAPHRHSQRRVTVLRGLHQPFVLWAEREQFNGCSLVFFKMLVFRVCFVKVYSIE